MARQPRDVSPELEHAREALARGDPEEAFLWLDEELLQAAKARDKERLLRLDGEAVRFADAAPHLATRARALRRRAVKLAREPALYDPIEETGAQAAASETSEGDDLFARTGDMPRIAAEEPVDLRGAGGSPVDQVEPDAAVEAEWGDEASSRRRRWWTSREAELDEGLDEGEVGVSDDVVAAEGEVAALEGDWDDEQPKARRWWGRRDTEAVEPVEPDGAVEDEWREDDAWQETVASGRRRWFGSREPEFVDPGEEVFGASDEEVAALEGDWDDEQPKARWWWGRRGSEADLPVEPDGADGEFESVVEDEWRDEASSHRWRWWRSGEAELVEDLDGGDVGVPDDVTAAEGEIAALEGDWDDEQPKARWWWGRRESEPDVSVEPGDAIEDTTAGDTDELEPAIEDEWGEDTWQEDIPSRRRRWFVSRELELLDSEEEEVVEPEQEPEPEQAARRLFGRAVVPDRGDATDESYESAVSANVSGLADYLSSVSEHYGVPTSAEQDEDGEARRRLDAPKETG